MSSKWNIYYHKYIALYSPSPPPPANPNMIHYLQTSYLRHLSPLSCLTSAISWSITTVLLTSYNSQNIDHGQSEVLHTILESFNFLFTETIGRTLKFSYYLSLNWIYTSRRIRLPVSLTTLNRRKSLLMWLRNLQPMINYQQASPNANDMSAGPGSV